jgi:hypothetical protein
MTRSLSVVTGEKAGVHETLDVTDETLLKVTETMERIVDTSSVVYRPGQNIHN